MLDRIIPGFSLVRVSLRDYYCYSGGSPIILGGLGKAFEGESLLVKIMLRERESVQEAVRRFRKLVDRTGLKRELRRRER